MMNKDIYPEGIENDPLTSKKDDLEGNEGLKGSVYTLKAGKTFVEKKKFSKDQKKGSVLDDLKQKFSKS